MDDLITKLRAAIDRAEEGDDWPHRRSCQMVKPVPPGFPFDTFTCNCDMPDLWLKLIAAHRNIVEMHDGPHECIGLGIKYVWTGAEGHCGAVLAIAQAYGIEA